MHQENLVGNPADLDALIKDRPPTEFEKHMHDLEVRRLQDLAQRIEGAKTECIEQEKQECSSYPMGDAWLGRHAWSLKCLLQDIRAASEALEGEQRANATLAVRHLEDAFHRINLALPDDEQT
jgi:hypothetical protein